MSCKRCFSFIRNLNHTWSILLLSLVWAIGLLLGTRLAVIFSLNIHTNPHAIIVSVYSPMRVLILSVFPFLLTILFLHFSLSPFIYLIVLSKGLLYSFSFSLISFTFPASGWLLHILFMFTQSITSVVLLWFWIRCADNCYDARSETSIALSLITVTCVVNQFIVFPFLTSLFNL